MAKAKGRYGTTGRVTPKKDAIVDLGDSSSEEGSSRRSVAASDRYTPPTPHYIKESPLWVPIMMFAFLALGVLLIVVNYTPVMPGGSSNWYLLGGLGLITLGFITATKYR